MNTFFFVLFLTSKHAVKQSIVIIICITDEYKQLPNCQSEVEYAYRLRKPLITVLLQSKYKPDGWLGNVSGNKIIY